MEGDTDCILTLVPAPASHPSARLLPFPAASAGATGPGVCSAVRRVVTGRPSPSHQRGSSTRREPPPLSLPTSWRGGRGGGGGAPANVYTFYPLTPKSIEHKSCITGIYNGAHLPRIACLTNLVNFKYVLYECRVSNSAVNNRGKYEIQMQVRTTNMPPSC